MGVLRNRQTQAQEEGAPYLRLVPNTDAMLHWLAKACADARVASQRKQVHIAAGADLDQSAVWRFEAGKGWPREPDKLIAAYADDLDIDPAQIWEAALEMWKADRASRPNPRNQAVDAAAGRTKPPGKPRPAAAKKPPGRRRPGRAA